VSKKHCFVKNDEKIDFQMLVLRSKPTTLTKQNTVSYSVCQALSNKNISQALSKILIEKFALKIQIFM